MGEYLLIIEWYIRPEEPRSMVDFTKLNDVFERVLNLRLSLQPDYYRLTFSHC